MDNQFLNFGKPLISMRGLFFSNNTNSVNKQKMRISVCFLQSLLTGNIMFLVPGNIPNGPCDSFFKRMFSHCTI